MKRQMPRACAGFDGSKRRIVGRQGSFAAIEFIAKDLVEPKGARDRKTVCVVRCDVMRVRTLLALRIGARPFVLNERRRFAELAITEDGDNLHAAAAVIGHENELSLLVHIEMAGAVATGSLLVQLCELAGGRVDGKRGDSAGTFA